MVAGDVDTEGQAELGDGELVPRIRAEIKQRRGGVGGEVRHGVLVAAVLEDEEAGLDRPEARVDGAEVGVRGGPGDREGRVVALLRAGIGQGTPRLNLRCAARRPRA